MTLPSQRLRHSGNRRPVIRGAGRHDYLPPLIGRLFEAAKPWLTVLLILLVLGLAGGVETGRIWP